MKIVCGYKLQHHFQGKNEEREIDDTCCVFERYYLSPKFLAINQVHRNFEAHVNN